MDQNLLERYRQELEKMNTAFFKAMTFRKEIVARIIEHKQGHGKFANYDPQREWEVFQKMRETLVGKSKRELLAFSLVMEDHAGASSRLYPSFFRLQHLAFPDHDSTWHRMNPLLLKLVVPHEFEKLELTRDFYFLRYMETHNVSEAPIAHDRGH